MEKLLSKDQIRRETDKIKKSTNMVKLVKSELVRFINEEAYAGKSNREHKEIMDFFCKKYIEISDEFNINFSSELFRMNEDLIPKTNKKQLLYYYNSLIEYIRFVDSLFVTLAHKIKHSTQYVSTGNIDEKKEIISLLESNIDVNKNTHNDLLVSLNNKKEILNRTESPYKIIAKIITTFAGLCGIIWIIYSIIIS